MSIYTFIKGQKKYIYQSEMAPAFYYVGRSKENTHTSNLLHVIDKETMTVKKVITLPYTFRTVNMRMFFHPKTKRLLVTGCNVDMNISYICIIDCISNIVINQASISGYSFMMGDFYSSAGLGIVGMQNDDVIAGGTKYFLLANLNTNKIYKLTANNMPGYSASIQITADSSNKPALIYLASASNSLPSDHKFYYAYINNITADTTITFTAFCTINGYTTSAMSCMADDYVKSPKYSQLRTFRTSTASTVSAFTVVGVNTYKTVSINSTYIGNRPCGYLASGGYYFPYGQTEAAKNGANFYYYNTLTNAGSTIAHGFGALNTNSFGISCGLHVDNSEASGTFDFFLYYGGASTSATTLRLICTGNVVKSFTVPQFYATAWQGLPTSDNKSIYYQNRVDNYVTNSGVIVGVSLANSSSNPVVTQYKIPQECVNLGTHSNFVVSWN